MVIHKKGDLLEASESILCQQVNCRGKMGKGLANAIRLKWPVVKENYLDYVYSCKAKGEQLLGAVQLVSVEDGKYVANLFGQDGYGTELGRQYTDIAALRKALLLVCEAAVSMNASVALPYKIGCSLGGADWNVVSAMIADVFSDYDVTIYESLGVNPGFFYAFSRCLLSFSTVYHIFRILNRLLRQFYACQLKHQRSKHDRAEPVVRRAALLQSCRISWSFSLLCLETKK